jgi:hypothetical protein
VSRVLTQIRETRTPAATYRVLACDCGKPDCPGYALVGAHQRQPKVWVALGSFNEAGFADALARLETGELDDMTGRCCALVGCSFRRLLDKVQKRAVGAGVGMCCRSG